MITNVNEYTDKHSCSMMINKQCMCRILCTRNKWVGTGMMHSWRQREVEWACAVMEMIWKMEGVRDVDDDDDVIQTTPVSGKVAILGGNMWGCVCVHV